MPRADIKSGLAFKTALLSACIFVVMLVVAGGFLVAAVTNTLEGELRAQSEEEIVLLERIYRAEGRSGLINAIDSLSRHNLPVGQASGVFDSSGIRLAGPLESAPPAIGWQRTKISYVEETRTPQTLYVKRVVFEDVTIVVGRSSRIIDSAQRWLIIWLVLLGGILTMGTLMIGYGASRKSLRKLRAMEDVLGDVSRGNMTARLAVSPDNDQIDRIASEVNQHIAQLSILMDRMRSTATAIAHDLKTFLSDAQISLHHALDTYNSGDDPSEKINAAQEELQNLNTTFETILRISRIQASGDTAKFETIDLSHLVREIAEFMGAMAEEKKQHIRLASALAHPMDIIADGGMIKQLLVNLIGNSIAHCPQGSNINLDAWQDNQGTMLVIEDNGPGIAEGERKRVLEPFARLDTARTTPGSGLGLAMVAAVVEHHRADLCLKDAEPGLRVEVKFPKV